MLNDLENICLKQDNGCDFTFRGRLFSESSWFDEEESTLTRQKLYVTESNEQYYYIVRSSGQQHNRHAYKLIVQGDKCIIDNGKGEMTMQYDLLMLAVRGLCGLEEGATPSLANVEEMLRVAANS